MTERTSTSQPWPLLSRCWWRHWWAFSCKFYYQVIGYLSTQN